MYTANIAAIRRGQGLQNKHDTEDMSYSAANEMKIPNSFHSIRNPRQQNSYRRNHDHMRYSSRDSPFFVPQINITHANNCEEQYYTHALTINPNNFAVRFMYSHWLITRKQSMKCIAQIEYLLQMMASHYKPLHEYELKMKCTLVCKLCNAYVETAKQNKKEWEEVTEFIFKFKNIKYAFVRSSQFINRLYFDSLRRIKPQKALDGITIYLNELKQISFETAQLWQLKGFILDTLGNCDKTDILQCYDISMGKYREYVQSGFGKDRRGGLKCALQFGIMRQMCVWRWNVPSKEYLRQCKQWTDEWCGKAQYFHPQYQIMCAEYYYWQYLQSFKTLSLNEENVQKSKAWLIKTNVCLSANGKTKAYKLQMMKDMKATLISKQLKAYFKKNFVCQYKDKSKGKMKILPLSIDNVKQLNVASTFVKNGEPSVVSSIMTNEENEGQSYNFYKN